MSGEILKGLGFDCEKSVTNVIRRERGATKMAYTVRMTVIKGNNKRYMF